MEKLLEMARKVCDKAEVYSIENTHNIVSFKNAKLHDIDSKFQSGLSLRVIKDGKLGFSYTRNLMSREELVQNALDSMKGGVEADYDFPLTQELADLGTYEPSLEHLSGTEMVEECARTCDHLKSNTDGEVWMTSLAHSENIHIMNSQGTDISGRTSLYGIYGGVVYPGTASGIFRISLSKKFKGMPDDLLEEMIRLYTQSSDVLEPKGGKLKVVFMPNSIYTLTWRIQSGTSSKNVYEKISPIADKAGETIFDKKLTFWDDPLNDKYPGARAFDDEGVACKPLTIVEDGVLKSFYYDLYYARKLNAEPTGHGYKSTRWGGDLISLKPVPALSHVRINPGAKSFSELVKSMDRGVVVEGALGAHSGNIPNGDYSIGVSPGLWVEKGEIVGRVKDAMVAGNIYETLKHVVDVGDTLHYSFGGWVPPILCDGVNVATRY